AGPSSGRPSCREPSIAGSTARCSKRSSGPAGMPDPATLMAIGLGTTAALGFGVVAGFASAASGRRYRRRLASVSSQKRNVAASGGTGAPEARALSRRESATPMIDRLIKRWLPHRDLLDARLTRTGRAITVGHYGMATAGLTVASILLVLIF